MANITITQTTNSIQVNFNDLSSLAGISMATWNKGKIINFTLAADEAYIIAFINDGSQYQLSFDGNNGMKVDTIHNGLINEQPSSNLDLFNKLSALIA
jgi:hypothetical protein